MDTAFLKHILDISFYTDNKPKLSKLLFEDETLELYDVIVEAHTKFGSDLTPDELFALWEDKNPTATNAKLKSMRDVVNQIEAEDKISPDVAATILNGLWQRNVGKKISQLGINMMEGKEDAFSKLTKLLEQSKDGFQPDDFGEDTTKNIEELLFVVSDANRWKFNINSLSKEVYGMAPGEFGWVLSRTNAGKTAFAVSLTAAPNGFLDQGARVAYLGNEEDPRRTMLRHYMAYSGMTKEEIIANPKIAVEAFDRVKDNLFVRGIAGWDMDRVEAYLTKVKPDFVWIDMLDKVAVPGGKELPSHERLKEVYTRARELAGYSKLNCSLLGFSQASDIATGKTIVTPDMAEGSKTGKGAEADLVLGIGMFAPDMNGDIDPVRYLTIGKNKINGIHTTVACKLNGAISRFTD